MRAGTTTGLATLVLLVVPLVVVVGVATRPALPADVVADQQIEPMVAALADDVLSDELPVSVALSWGDGPTLQSSGGDELLTRVWIESGSQVVSGVPVVDRGPVTVVALVADAPLWRDLTWAMTGNDVTAVAELLVDLDLLDPDDVDDPPEVNGPFQRAVERFNDRFGHRDSRRFFHQAVAWTPQPVELAEVVVAPGQPMPPVGQPLATGASLLVAVSYTDANGAVAVPRDNDTTLQVVDLSVPLDPASGQPTPEGLELLGGTYPVGTESVFGRLTSGGQLPVHPVPVSAVIVDGADTCLAVPNGGGWTRVAVDVVDSGFGQSTLEALDEPPERFLVNPGQVGVDGCG